jgi:hypothetical protein
LCLPNRDIAASTASSEGWTSRLEIAMELCPAIRASVQASQPDCPSRVRNVCRNAYRRKRVRGGRSFFFACSVNRPKHPDVLLLKARMVYMPTSRIFSLRK